MRTALIAAAVGLIVSGCQTMPVDAAIHKSLPKICADLASDHTAFVAVAALGTVSEATIDRENTAYSGGKVICSAPADTTASDALVVVARAYVAVATALVESRAVK